MHDYLFAFWSTPNIPKYWDYYLWYFVVSFSSGSNQFRIERIKSHNFLITWKVCQGKNCTNVCIKQMIELDIRSPMHYGSFDLVTAGLIHICHLAKLTYDKPWPTFFFLVNQPQGYGRQDPSWCLQQRGNVADVRYVLQSLKITSCIHSARLLNRFITKP